MPEEPTEDGQVTLFDQRIRLIIDSDVDNEIDDPFALAYALGRPDRFDLRAITIAPYQNDRCASVAESIDRSVALVQEFLAVAKRPELPVIPGARQIMASVDDAVESEAVTAIIQEARRAGPPLVIAAIGAATNVASALRLAPEIEGQIRVAWLGGNPPYWSHTWEFNLAGDRFAAEALMSSRVPLIWIPCQGVASHLLTTLPTMERDWAPTGAVGEWLTQLLRGYVTDHQDYAKELWDIAAIAALVSPALVEVVNESKTPRWDESLRWRTDAQFDRPITRITSIHRNAVFADVRQALRQIS